jgi:TolB-like protein/Tfp pilus assembly protein PilF
MSQDKDIAEGDRGRRLDSWKAIATFLDRDVRSVQRWEHERGLPVYRLPGQKGGAVFAYERELEQWMRSRGSEARTVPDPAFGAASDIPASGEAGRQPPGRPLRIVAGTIAAAAVVVAISAYLGFHQMAKQPPAATPFAPPSIAVLPMQNFSGDAAQDYFADGFTDELTTELAQVRSLRVISRTSTMVYKKSRRPLPQIARELHVTYVLEGSVEREGSRVRVIEQLIDARSDTHVSARTYDADVKDVLDIQSQISRAIADDVRVDLSPAEKTRLAAIREVDPQAHDLYLQASYAFAQQTPDSIRKSLDLYQAAASKDPSFARAYVGIALAELALLQITAQSPDETFRYERAALEKALALDPYLGEAHGLFASLVYYHDWNWPRAEREFRLALTEGAQAPTEQRFGTVLVTRGLFAEGMVHIQRAIELDPMGKSPKVNLLTALLLQNRIPEAKRYAENLLAADPNFLAAHVLMASTAHDQHDCPQEAVQSQWISSHYPSAMADVNAALTDSCRGDVAAARRNLEHAISRKSPAFASHYQIALGYGSIHDREATLSNLEKSSQEHEPQIFYMKTEPIFDWLRSEPRFVALETRLGLLQ